MNGFSLHKGFSVLLSSLKMLVSYCVCLKVSIINFDAK